MISLRIRVHQFLKVYSGTAATIFVLALITYNYSDHIPIWDGGWYMKYLQSALDSPFRPIAYATGHSAFSFFGYYAIFSKLAPNSIWPLHLASFLLVSMSSIYFGRVLKLLLPKLSIIENNLIVASLIFQPIVLGNLLNPTPDLVMFCLIIPFFYFLFKNREVHHLLTGTLMIFTKGTATIFYAISALTYLRLFGNGKATLRKIILLATPIIIYLWWQFFASSTFPEQKNSWQFLFDDYKSGTFFRPLRVSNLVFSLLLIGSFNWLALLTIAARLIQRVRTSRSTSNPRLPDNFLKFESFFLVILLIGMATLSIHMRNTNARYVLIFLPIYIIIFSNSLFSLIPNFRHRVGFLVIYFSLIFVSAFRTIDPISRWKFGLLQFGQHQLLKVNGPKSTMNRDSLIYNLEYLQLSKLQNQLFSRLQPMDRELIFSSEMVNFHFQTPIDQTSGIRQLRRGPNTFDFSYRSVNELKNNVDLPEKIFFVIFPNFASKNSILEIKKFYKELGNETIAHNGYEIQLLTFKKI